MSCGCENRRLASEIDRARRLAKGLAILEQATVALYRSADGTYGFAVLDRIEDKEIIEYITPY